MIRELHPRAIEHAGQYTLFCIYCGEDFTRENPCCCDAALDTDGYHLDGQCKRCCDHYKNGGAR